MTKGGCRTPKDKGGSILTPPHKGGGVSAHRAAGSTDSSHAAGIGAAKAVSPASAAVSRQIVRCQRLGRSVCTGSRLPVAGTILAAWGKAA